MDRTGSTRIRRVAGADEGQTTLEWMGTAAIVVGLVVAMLLAAPGLGESVADRWQCLLSTVLGDGGACGGSERAGEPQRACTTSVTTGSAGIGVRIVVVDAEAGKQVVIRETSDGMVHVTFIDEGSLGASGKIGATGGIDVGEVSIGLGAQGTLGAALGGESGDTRVFDNPSDAEAYIADRLIDEGISLLPPGISHGADLAKDIGNWILGRDPPQGTDGGGHAQVDISAEGEVKATAGPLQAEAEVAVEAGARVTTRPDGSRTVRLMASADVAASLGIPLANIGAEGGVEVHLELDFDADGNAVAARVRVIGEGGLDSSFTPSITDVADGLTKVAGSLTGSDTTRTVVTAELDLTDPVLGDAFGDLVGATVDAATGQGSLRDVTDAGSTVADALAAAGTLSIEQYDVGSLKIGVEAEGNVGIGVGGKIGVEGSQATLVDAHYLDPVSGALVRWDGCLAGAN
ncbi:hypothetical protein BH23ACT9_BH23ACT9_10570 [soil metagenome]